MLIIRISCTLCLFLGFIVQTQAQTDSASAKKFNVPDSTKVILAGKMPAFRDGADAEFGKYIQENLVIPKNARKLHIKGTVFVQYSIDTDGKIYNVTVVPGRGLHPSLDKAAVDVISHAPDWSPGTNNGIPVRVKKIARVIFL